MRQLFSGVAFAGLDYLPLIILFLLVVGFLIVWRLRKVYHVKKILMSRANTSLLISGSSWRLLAKAGLLFLGVLLLSCALLRPQWNKKDEMVKQEGRDLLIAVDVSRSMLAQDCPPNRLAVTKQKIRSLVEHLSCERIGLLLFSGTACVQCPLTTDRAAFFLFLDALDVETLSSGTTALDEAIKKALAVFQQVPSRKNKMLVLFTDGEDFSSNLAGVKRAAQQENMAIFAVGVGTPEGAPIPLFDEKGNPAGHQKDKKGGVVISRLNEAMLRSLAQESGGFYVRASCADDRDIDQLVHKVAQVEKETLEDKKISHLEEQYHYLLIGSFVCFALEWIL